jgi:RNA polymerase sigma-70 factor (sigma-E family)
MLRRGVRAVEVFGLDPDVREAFDEYVRARGPRLVRTAYLFTGDRHVAEDVVQNALASLIVSWRRLRDVANLDAYVYRSVVNAGRRWRRRRWTGEIPYGYLPEEEAVAEDAPARFDGRTDMIAALRRLPPRQRAVLVLRYYADLSEAETAAVLGCSVGTVKSQSSRGLAALRAALEDQRGAAPDRPPGAPPPPGPPRRREAGNGRRATGTMAGRPRPRGTT